MSTSWVSLECGSVQARIIGDVLRAVPEGIEKQDVVLNTRRYLVHCHVQRHISMHYISPERTIPSQRGFQAFHWPLLCCDLPSHILDLQLWPHQCPTHPDRDWGTPAHLDLPSQQLHGLELPQLHLQASALSRLGSLSETNKTLQTEEEKEVHKRRYLGHLA